MAARMKKAVDEEMDLSYEKGLLKKLSALTSRMAEGTEDLEKVILELKTAKDVAEEGAMIRDRLLPAMNELRIAADEAETVTAKKYWPFPTYGDLLFGVR